MPPTLNWQSVFLQLFYSFCSTILLFLSKKVFFFNLLSLLNNYLKVFFIFLLYFNSLITLFFFQEYNLLYLVPYRILCSDKLSLFLYILIWRNASYFLKYIFLCSGKLSHFLHVFIWRNASYFIKYILPLPTCSVTMINFIINH